MIKIITVIGARPQFIKASAISRAIARSFRGRISEQLLHTGQHYDANMSQVFFDELEIPAPAFNLHSGSGSHGAQTALMLDGIEKVLQQEKPDVLLVYGDTNSTLAGALAAAKMHIPVVHVEAGIRSFNKLMPEEVNRILCDQVSSMVFTPTASGIHNLQREGIAHDPSTPVGINNPVIYHCGDVMYDVAMYFMEQARSRDFESIQLAMQPQRFILCTIHRDHNTDDPVRLNSLFSTLVEITRKHDLDIVLPLHPRTRKMMDLHLEGALREVIRQEGRIQITEPVSYVQTQFLLSRCELVMTDSGGLQKEAFFHHKPVLVLRPETEWVELLEGGHAVVCDVDRQRIMQVVQDRLQAPITTWPAYYGDGKAAEFICDKILQHFG